MEKAVLTLDNVITLLSNFRDLNVFVLSQFDTLEIQPYFLDRNNVIMTIKDTSDVDPNQWKSESRIIDRLELRELVKSLKNEKPKTKQPTPAPEDLKNLIAEDSIIKFSDGTSFNGSEDISKFIFKIVEAGCQRTIKKFVEDVIDATCLKN